MASHELDRRIDHALDSVRGVDLRLEQAKETLLANANVNTKSVLAGHDKTLDRVRAMGDRLEAIHSAQRALIADFRTEFDAYAKQDQRDRQYILAYICLLDKRAELDRRFSHYEAIRRSVQGMLMTMDSGVVRHTTMDEVSGRLTLDAPRYWLAFAQDALVGWIRNDRGVAEQALVKAMVQDRNRTSLFLALVNARYRRDEDTETCVREYLKVQNPQRLAREFLVVLDAAMLGVLGQPAHERIAEACQEWFNELSPDATDRQITWWEETVFGKWSARDRERVDSDRRFPTLATMCSDWETVADWHRMSTVFAAARREVRNLLPEPVEGPQEPADRIDHANKILSDLVNIQEDEEAELRRDIASLQHIIDHRGDVAEAEAEEREQAPRREPVDDLLGWINKAALRFEEIQVSRNTRQFAVHLARPWISGAVRRRRHALTERRPTIVVRIGDWKGELGEHTDVDKLVADLVEEVQRQTEAKVDRRRQPLGRSLAGLATAAGLLLLAFGWVQEPLLVPAALVLIPPCGGITLWSQQRIPSNVRQAREDGVRRRTEGESRLRKAFEEYQKMEADWGRSVRNAEELMHFVDGVATPVVPFPGDDRGTRGGAPDGGGHGRGEGAYWRPTEWSLAPSRPRSSAQS